MADRCPVPGCRKARADYQLTCAQHWQLWRAKAGDLMVWWYDNAGFLQDLEENRLELFRILGAITRGEAA